MRWAKRLRIGIVALALVFLALFVCHFVVAAKQYIALQAALGTSEDPVVFMARSIRPGMTREEVRRFVRGYRRHEFNPPGLSQGGADLFDFSFGTGLLHPLEEHGTIIVVYDVEGRVKEEATADLN